jgi:thioredoxin 2
MTTIEPDERGLIRACPHCGQRNRLIYERLGAIFRCTKCQTEIPPPTEPVEVSDMSNFDALISRSALPVLVDFWAPWCGPCRMMAPELGKVAADGPGRWLIAKVNSDELSEVSARFGIRAIPTLILFKAGHEAARQSGALPAPAILRFLQQSLPM